MATVTIESVVFTTYASVAEADAYLIANIDYATWNANDIDTKGRFLSSATRLLDQQRWLKDYGTFAERVVVADIVSASIELANYLSNGNTAVLGLDEQEPSVKRLKAGSAEIENFRNAAMQSAGRYITVWPSAVFSLLRDYLDSASGSALGALSYATDTRSSIVDSGLLGN